ncbi:MAG: hypothetical protein PHV51_04455 [Methanosarcinaceae archaeon]|nr:hypothetical protein [Methanosarcinaceae archaeon]
MEFNIGEKLKKGLKEQKEEKSQEIREQVQEGVQQKVEVQKKELEEKAKKNETELDSLNKNRSHVFPLNTSNYPHPQISGAQFSHKLFLLFFTFLFNLNKSSYVPKSILWIKAMKPEILPLMQK